MDFEAQVRSERFELNDPLDGIYMSDADREYVRVTMQQAERIADFLLLAWRGVRSLASSLMRAGMPASIG
jgi:hypothetical protein